MLMTLFADKAFYITGRINIDSMNLNFMGASLDIVQKNAYLSGHSPLGNEK